MNWVMVLDLLSKFGPSILPLVEKLWKLIATGGAPTAADWEELRALANQIASSQMRDALIRAGIPLDSPQAISLLALTVPKTP